MNNSLGSAIKENEAYMQSLEAQTNNLKATFQDLSNRVISKDLISAFLNLANNGLGLVDNKVGATIIQFGLLTTALIGAAGVAKEFLPAFIAGFTGIGSEAAVAAGGVKGFLAILGGFAPYAAAIAAIAVAVGLVGKAVYDWYNNTHKSIEEYDKLIGSANEKLETNKERLAEINSMPWSQKTADILAEKAAIEEENEKLQDQIDKYDELKKESAERTLKAGGITTVQKWSVTGASKDSEVLGWATDRANALYDSLQDIVDALPAAQAGTEATEEALKGLGLQFEKVDTQARLFGDEYENNLIKRAKELTNQIKNNQGDYEGLRAEYDEVISKLGELADAHDVLDDKQTVARDTLDDLNRVYEEYSYIAEQAAGSTELTKDQVADLTSKYPKLASTIDTVNGKNYLNVDSLAAVTGATKDEITEIYNAVAAMTVLNNTQLDFSQQIGEIAKLGVALGVAQSEINAFTSGQQAGIQSAILHEATMTGQKMSVKQAQEEYLKTVWNRWMAITDFSPKVTKGSPDTSPTTPSTKSSSASKKASNEAAKSQKKEKTAVELSTEAWKEQLSLLKDKLELLEKSGATDQDQIDQMIAIQKAIHEQADKYRALNLGNESEEVRQLGILWWDYANDISALRKKMADEKKKQDDEDEAEEKERLEKAKARAEELYETEKKLWEERLEKQKSDYETAVNVVLKKIDEEVEKLNKQRDETEKFYDDQIQALQDTNDELDRQIQKEELLENLAKAQDKTLYVFKDGRFQYLQDTEAIAEAQAQLDAYNREEALRKETENLNKQKENALKAIDAQIEGWNKYREQWEKVTTDYQEQQDKLIAQQVLGIDLEQKNWQTRLTNVQDFVDKYNNILSQLDAGYPKTLKDYYKDQGLNSDGSAWNGSGYDPGTGSGGTLRDDGKVDYKDDSPRKDMDKNQDGKPDSGWLKDQGAPDWVVNSAKQDEKKSSSSRRHANGTLSAEPGLSLVGERGPELRVLGGGEGIIPADITRNLWNWGKINPGAFAQSTNNVFNIDNLSLPSVTNAQNFITGLRQMAYQRAYKRA
nr:MAG TPA: tail tape measure protein [Caudoviricetes sp.]